MKGRNIGGSILPSSSPQILTPLPFRAGSLQVVALPEVDTHALTYQTGLGISLLCTHSNGHSCHNLAKRIIAGDPVRVREQAQYVLDCGGTCRSIEAVCELLAPIVAK